MTADDNKWWIDALYGVIATLWVALGGLWAYVWKEVAMKSWVKDQIKASADEDETRDRRLVADLLAPVLVEIGAVKEQTHTMHTENRERLDKILRTIEQRRN